MVKGVNRRNTHHLSDHTIHQNVPIHVKKQKSTCKSLHKKIEPHVRTTGRCLLIARNVTRLCGKAIKELRATVIFNFIFVPGSIWKVVKLVRKINPENKVNTGLAIGVNFSEIFKDTGDLLGGLSALEVGGQQLAVASQALMGIGIALSVLAIIVNVKSIRSTHKFMKSVQRNEKSIDEIIANLKIKDPKTVKKMKKLWKRNENDLSKRELKKLIIGRYSQKIKSISLSILTCVISIVAISLILAATATPVGWGLLVTLGVILIGKYLYDKHAYSKFKSRIQKLDVINTKFQGSRLLTES